MSDTLMAFHTLKLICNSLEQILKRCSDIHNVNDFLLTESGTMKLDSICMKLTAIGECIKNLDKITDKKLLVDYPEIPWKNIMGIRDIIVHHYFDIDADEIFRICKKDIPQLLQVIRKMINDLHYAN
ncbi:DUF86 domain-containing protein [Odoribacter lunatus]|uniref:HepT-like ribonuclease domain-containing protein n=1 Tax=Odoribacter lunatus TaxID=2941335 RepID=UPI0020417181|nr:HepT-like ribonuclease domain-containing protein [Odoribacter lunatus]